MESKVMYGFLLLLLISGTAATGDWTALAIEVLGRVSLKELLNLDAVKDEHCRNDLRYWTDALDLFIVVFNANCTADDQQCIEEKRNNTNFNEFAARQLDSFGRLPPNVFGLNALWLGSWDECMEVKSIRYKTQFCHLDVGINVYAPVVEEFQRFDQAARDVCELRAKPRWSVCMPQSCSNEDVAAAFKTKSEKPEEIMKVCTAKCRPTSGPKLDLLFWAVMIFCCSCVAAAIVASCFEVYTDCDCRRFLRKSTCAQCLLAFSFIKNSSDIADSKKYPGRINCLHCIRTFTMSWIIIGHVISVFIWASDNPMTLFKETDYILNDALFNSFLTVDTFLFLSGLLLGYLFYREAEKNVSKLRSWTYWFLYYAHRIARLTPVYIIFLLFVTVIHEHVTIGPLVLDDQIKAENCRKYWWRNLLYINNLFGTNGVCLGHSWYLALDFQIYAFAPLLLVPLLFSPLLGYIIAFVLLAISTIICYYFYYLYDFPANHVGFYTDIFDMKKVHPYKLFIYDAPWIRFTPYIIGIFTGRFLYRTRGKPLPLNWMRIVFLWTSSTAVALVCVYGLYDYFRGPEPEHQISVFARASYNNWSRIGWALSLAWLVIACEKDLAGPVKSFMELGFWAPFGRLTYCVYLSHFLIIDGLFAFDRQPLHFSSPFQAYVRDGLPVFFACYLFAYFWSCVFELPFGKLEKMAIAAAFGSKNEKKPEDQSTRRKQDAGKADMTNYSNGCLSQEQNVYRIVLRL